MDNMLFYKRIFILILSTIALIYLSIKYFKGGILTHPDKAIAPMKEFVIKHGRRITTFLYLIITVLCLSFILSSMPLIKDIPHLISNEYKSIEGKSINDSKEGYKRQERTVTIVDPNTHKKVKITFLGNKDIEKGDYLKLYYYPNSKIGAYQNPDDGR